MKNRTFIASDGRSIYCYFFIPDASNIKGIVQIVHGLGDHTGRYIEFATKLARSGYLVCSEDHRGFGRTAISKEMIGHMADSDGYNLIMGDMFMVMEHTKSQYPNVPYFMFGHSMGSFLTRSFIVRHPTELDGIILSGTKGKPFAIEGIGKQIVKIQKFFLGGRAKARFIDKLSIGGYSKKYFPQDDCPIAWLTSDKTEQKKILEDEYFSNKPSSLESYVQLFILLDEIQSPSNIAKIPKSMPMLLIAGAKDPITDFGKGIVWLYNMYKSIGVSDLEYKLYEDGRHEILKDKDRYEFMDLVVEWLDKRAVPKSLK